MYATKVADGIYLLDTLALGWQRVVSAYVVRGQKTALVDCGYASSYQNVLLGLAELGIAPSDVNYVIPTHVHLDHAGAAGHLMKELPNAELIAHENGVPHLADPTRLVESATRVFGKVIVDLYGAPIPVPEARMTPVGKEAHLDLGEGMTATLMHTPGHAPHQISVMLDGPKILLTADAVGVVYPDVGILIPTTPPPSFEPKTLSDTVNQLGQMGPRKLLLPHFGTRADADFVFEKTRERVAEWVAKVGRMKKEGLQFDEMAELMAAEVKSEAGVVELPIYAKASVRMSVMGISHYLDKNV